MFSYRMSDDVELRLLEERYVEEYYEVNRRNRERLYWLKEDYSLEDARSFLKRDMVENFANNNGFQAGIWVEGKFAGAIRFNQINWKTKQTSLGYWLDAQFEGRGLMLKACRIFIAYAFNELKLNRVEIRCLVDNLRSRAVAERLGFKQDGILRQAELAYDRLNDLAVYSLLADEWRDNEQKPETPASA